MRFVLLIKNGPNSIWSMRTQSEERGDLERIQGSFRAGVRSLIIDTWQV